MRNMKRSIRIWCIWGALLAGIPYALNNPAIIMYGVHPHFAPLQSPVLVLGISVVSIILVSFFQSQDKSSFEHSTNRAPLLFMFVTLPIAALCEAGWIPMTFQNFALIGYQGIFSAIGWTAQILSWVAWTWYGTINIPQSSAQPALSTARHRHALTFAVAALWPSFISIAASTFMRSWQLEIILCLVSCGAGYIFCLSIAQEQISSESFLIRIAFLLGGALSAAAFREASSELLVSTLYMPITPDYARAFALATAFLTVYLIIIVIITTFITRYAKQNSPTNYTAELSRDYIISTISQLSDERNLSARQKEIVLESARGISTSSIAKELHLSPGTIGTYRVRALKRLGFASLEELQGYMNNAKKEHAAADQALWKRISHRRASFGLTCLIALIFLAHIQTFYESFLKWEDHLFLALSIFTGALLILLSLLRHAQQSSMKHETTQKNPHSALLAYLSLPFMGATLYHFLWIGPERMPQALIASLLSSAILCFQLMEEAIGSESKKQSFIQMLLVGVYRLYLAHPLSNALLGMGLLAIPVINCLYDGWMVLWQLLSLLLATQFFCIVLMFTKAHSQRTSEDAQEALDGHSPFLISMGLGEVEAQIAILISQGFTGRQIQEKLHLAPGTVNGYRASAYRKLNVKNREDLTKLLGKRAGQICR